MYVWFPAALVGLAAGIDAEVEDEVTMQEQAEEIRDGRPERWETYDGRFIVTVLVAAV
jgi:hypothetical protein